MLNTKHFCRVCRKITHQQVSPDADDTFYFECDKCGNNEITNNINVNYIIQSILEELNNLYANSEGG